MQRHFQLHGHQLCHCVHLLIRHVQHAAHIADDGARRHGAECHNLCHMVCTVFTDNIVYHFTAPLITEIHVKVRHGHALRVQKAFEKQLIADRVNIRDADAVGRKASGAGAAARPHWDAPLPRIIDKIVHDEIIVHIPHAVDNAYLIIQPPAHLVWGLRPIAALQPLFTQADKIAAVVLSVRRFKIRQLRHAEFKIEITLLRNFVGIFARFRPG